MQTTINQSSENTAQADQNAAQSLQHRSETVASLSGIFGFFSRVLEQEIDAEFLHALRYELKQPLQEAGMEFDEDFLTAEESRLLERYAEEFTGLFVAPGCVSPYASVFETGCMFKEPADRASAAYVEAGWSYKNRYSGEFPDHIGTMLGFYGMLCESEAEYLGQGLIDNADQIKARREQFLLQQLAEWGPGWCHLAARASTLSFYQQVLSMVEQLLWSELSQLLDRRDLKTLVQKNQRDPKRLDYDADFRKASGL